MTNYVTPVKHWKDALLWWRAVVEIEQKKKKKIEKELTDMDNSTVIVGWKSMEVEEGMVGVNGDGKNIIKKKYPQNFSALQKQIFISHSPYISFVPNF